MIADWTRDAKMGKRVTLNRLRIVVFSRLCHNFHWFVTRYNILLNELLGCLFGCPICIEVKNGTVESEKSKIINARPVHFIKKIHFMETQKIIKKIIKFYVKNAKLIFFFFKRTQKSLMLVCFVRSLLTFCTVKSRTTTLIYFHNH